MPTYQYKCETCGKEFEVKQRITEPALTTCPDGICTSESKGKGQVHRIISRNVGLVFKGSGFYLTDYVHKNNSVSSPANGTSKHATTERATSKTENATTKAG